MPLFATHMYLCTSASKPGWQALINAAIRCSLLLGVCAGGGATSLSAVYPTNNTLALALCAVRVQNRVIRFCATAVGPSHNHNPLQQAVLVCLSSSLLPFALYVRFVFSAHCSGAHRWLLEWVEIESASCAPPPSPSSQPPFVPSSPSCACPCSLLCHALAVGRWLTQQTCKCIKVGLQGVVGQGNAHGADPYKLGEARGSDWISLVMCETECQARGASSCVGGGDYRSKRRRQWSRFQALGCRTPAAAAAAAAVVARG